MALDREVTIPDEVLDLVSGRLVRPDEVARIRDYMEHGGTWKSEAVAGSIVDAMLTARTT